MLWYVLIIIMIAIDQITKLIVIKNISLENVTAVINGFFYIMHLENNGIAFSMLNNKRFIFIPISMGILILIGYYLYRSNNIYLKVPLLLISGGAIGNLIDRIVRGSVTDFLQLHIGSYITPVFNVADMFVIIGTLLLLYCFLFKSDKITN
jgi:signal peptidase II